MPIFFNTTAVVVQFDYDTPLEWSVARVQFPICMLSSITPCIRDCKPHIDTDNISIRTVDVVIIYIYWHACSL